VKKIVEDSTKQTREGRLSAVIRYRTAAAALSVAVFAAAMYWGSMVAGGADSSGYVNQARLWREGRLVIQQPIVPTSPWPFRVHTWTPLGFRPAAHEPSAIVPLYPPGLPLLMALAQALLGFCGAFLITPICGGAIVWLTYILGRRLFDAPGDALIGAVLVALSPNFLYQLMNPMSDVPATAAWALALVLTIDERPALAGLAMAVAIAIRPNLALLAMVPIVWTAIRSPRSAMVAGIAAAPGVAGVLWFNMHLYGSPLISGYGRASDLYAWGYATANIAQYTSWMMQAETPVVALSLLFVVAQSVVGPPRIRHARLLCGGLIAATVLSYLFYEPFQAWWFLRYLLPMWPVLMLLTASALVAVLRRLAGASQWIQSTAIAACLAMLAWHNVEFARAHDVFALGRGERRYVDVARFVDAWTDPNAVMISWQHSGSLRVYAGRLTLRFDLLDPAFLDRAVAYLGSVKRHPYVVLDISEVAAFRARFEKENRLGRLDWTPIGELEGSVVVYDALNPGPGPAPAVIKSTADAGWYCQPGSQAAIPQ
jgi:hypothetical protein